MSNENTIPVDDGARELTAVGPDDPELHHLAVVGDTYTILVSGDDTDGRYTLIDMLIPADGGPPPHRHDFEEMFHVLGGEVDVTIRGETTRAGTGETVNIPALAPHSFHNPTGQSIRLLCLAAPAGLEEYFAEFGDPLPARTSAAPKLSEDELGERLGKAVALAAKYRIETL
jgi:mannose-6-phosphate isomerase-like protein (cupin superfamily)